MLSIELYPLTNALKSCKLLLKGTQRMLRLLDVSGAQKATCDSNSAERNTERLVWFKSLSQGRRRSNFEQNKRAIFRCISSWRLLPHTCSRRLSQLNTSAWHSSAVFAGRNIAKNATPHTRLPRQNKMSILPHTNWSARKLPVGVGDPSRVKCLWDSWFAKFDVQLSVYGCTVRPAGLGFSLSAFWLMASIGGNTFPFLTRTTFDGQRMYFRRIRQTANSNY